VPEVTALTAPYWEAAERGAVALQRCLDCGHVWHPPMPTCPHGTAHRIEWFDATGAGSLHSVTAVHHAAHPAVGERLPYLVALVDLVEGPRIITTLLDADESGVRMGMPVRISLGPATGGLLLAVARPDDAGAAAARARRA
jgi:uncharacterized OB-fold protein